MALEDRHYVLPPDFIDGQYLICTEFGAEGWNGERVEKPPSYLARKEAEIKALEDTIADLKATIAQKDGVIAGKDATLDAVEGQYWAKKESRNFTSLFRSESCHGTWESGKSQAEDYVRWAKLPSDFKGPKIPFIKGHLPSFEAITKWEIRIHMPVLIPLPFLKEDTIRSGACVNLESRPLEMELGHRELSPPTSPRSSRRQIDFNRRLPAEPQGAAAKSSGRVSPRCVLSGQ
ncbi:unnamed protein product [Vitrella brassicaformis CCMP3155]|uniref:Uncharacterized protein n=1 Tax=Vitrella brassicaformis (strain CCMP3155) TaxID=1169540 RepID=A0A0G4G5J1_VITBC|nr:unnamed protein product [Vitrella brassicaformis CCMP3155]|eukprot:CEM23733.1 unnamed protein product [Vitrella brassicaformis CCMP3155]